MYLEDKFSLAKAHLIFTEPFYAMLAQQCAIEVNEKVGTISVKEEDGIIYLVYSEKWIKNLSFQQIAEAIKHVLNHLIFNHLGNEMFNIETLRMKLAQDLAINSCLDKTNLPKGFIHPDIMNFTKDLSTFEYYNLLPEDPKIPSCGDGESGGKNKEDKKDKDSDNKNNEIYGDNHDFMTTSVTEYQIQQQISNMVKEAHMKSGGRLPSQYGSSICEMIKLLIAPPEIPWEQVLKNFVAFSSRVFIQSTWKKINRRFGEDYKGKKKIQRVKIMVALDESGSISDKEWTKFMSEIEGMFRTNRAEISIAKFTTQIEDFFEYKGIKHVTKKRFYGGTAFQPFFTLAEEFRPDVLIVLTDGYNWDTPCKYSKKGHVLWVLTQDGKLNENFGKTIKIRDTIKNKNIHW